MWFTLSVTDLCNCPCIYTCGRGVDHATGLHVSDYVWVDHRVVHSCILTPSVAREILYAAQIKAFSWYTYQASTTCRVHHFLVNIIRQLPMRGPVQPIQVYIHVLLQRFCEIAGNHFSCLIEQLHEQLMWLDTMYDKQPIYSNLGVCKNLRPKFAML